MNVIIIGTDRTVFKEGSAVRERLIEYGGLVDELHVVVFARKGFSRQKLADNVWVYPTDSNSKLSYIRDAKQVAAAIIRDKKFTPVETIVSVQDPFETGLVGLFLKKRFGFKLQAQVHTDFLSPYFWRHSTLNFLRSFIAWRILPKADQIRVVSRRIERSLVAHPSRISRKKIAVLPICTNQTRLAAPATFDLSKKYPQFSDIILMSSRLAREKNIPLALRVFKNILADFPTVGLLIFGDGSEKAHLQRLVKNLKMEESVIFEPWTNDLPSYYKTASIFLSTSLYEGYGLTLIEAAASAAAIVTSDVGIAGDILIDGRNARVCPVGDEAAFTRALKELLVSTDTRQALGRAAQADVEALPMSKESYLEQYKDLFVRTLRTTKIERLLIVTQSVDLDNPVLGFFHRWIEEFATHFDSVTVICLKRGRIALPANVTVLSLGKESGVSRVKYLWRFYRFIWRARRDYDAVFVHMNPIYVILGGLFWKAWRKKITLWYVHRNVDFKLRLAHFFVDQVYSATSQSFRLASKKVCFVGQAVDTVAYARPESFASKHHGSFRIISVGRVTPIKNLDTIIEAIALLKNRGVSAHLEIVGEAIYPADIIYKKKLQELIAKHQLEKEIVWSGAVPPAEVAKHYWQNDVSVNAAPSGGMDKSVLESMAAGVPVFTSNTAFKELFGEQASAFIFKERDAKDLAEKIEELRLNGNFTVVGEKLQSIVKAKADISKLIEFLATNLKSK